MRLGKGVAGASLIVAAITLPIMTASGCTNKPATLDQGVARVEGDIHEHLPVGSSRSEVAAYLDNRGYQHSHIGESKFPESEGTEIAMIRGVKNGLIRTDIQMVFKFGNTDTKLVSYSVREVFTGP